MGGYFDPQQQQIIVETVEESMLWIKILLAMIPVIGGIITAIFIRRKK